MPSQFFAPNSSLSGGAMFVSFNSKEGCVFLKILRQIANNIDKKNNFDGKNPINIKLSQDEVSDIIRAIRVNGESKFYHKFNTTVTSGNFNYYMIKDSNPLKSGFGLTVKKNQDSKETKVKIGFTLGGAERLSLFLQNALTHIFDAIYSQDLKDTKEYQSKKKESVSSTVEELHQDNQPEGEVEF